MFGMEFGILAFIGFVLWIYALIKIVGSGASGISKAIWIAIVFFFPILGFIIWLIFGPK